jgi:hypothetical protein
VIKESAILSVGIVAGGAGANRDWEMAVKKFGLRVIEARKSHSSPLAVNLVYHIPGEVFSLGFEGVRAGRYSTSDKRLLVQVGLPRQPAGDADQAVKERLEDAVLAAEQFARSKGLIIDELSDLRAVVKGL